MTALAATGVTVRYGTRTALDGVDMAVGQGQMVGLIGPNGAGKSTLLRTLAGLQRPDAGTVTLDTVPLRRVDRRERGRRLAYLDQDNVAHWPLTVARLVALGRLPGQDRWRPDDAADRAAVAQALTACAVAPLADRPITALSGGERRRVLLARVLAGEPDILLADEPTAGLDAAHALRIMALLRDAVRRGAGVVVVLHDLTLAARFCDRLALLADGRLHAAGPVDAVLTRATLERVYGVHMLMKVVDGQRLVVPWRLPNGTAPPNPFSGDPQ